MPGSLASTRHTLVGFENHSGKTYLGAGLAAARHGCCAAPATTARTAGKGWSLGNVFGTYLHGSLLPKNPHFADLLIARAMGRHGPVTLAPLRLSRGLAAHDAVSERLVRCWLTRQGRVRRSRPFAPPPCASCIPRLGPDPASTPVGRLSSQCVSIPWANDAGSTGSQKTATPSAISRKTGMSLQTIGTPQAMASMTGRPKPSAREGRTTAAAARYSSGTASSAAGPVKPRSRRAGQPRRQAPRDAGDHPRRSPAGSRAVSRGSAKASISRGTFL